MSIVKDERQERLELGGVGGPVEVEGRAGGPNAGLKRVIRRKPGVLVFEDIPAGLIVHARLSWAHDLQGEDVGSRAVGAGAAGAPLAYRFERAPVPTVVLPGGATVRSGKRFLIPSSASPFGPVTHVEFAPVWAAFAPAQDGTLYQRGKAEHAIPMPGLGAGEEREWLRLRWVGTPVAGATLLTLAAETEAEDVAWASGHRHLTPGSIVITLPSGAVLRDDGRGRLLTADGGAAYAGDGLVDYQSGAFKLRFAAAETGAVLVDYEHDTPYHPLDVTLAWDALLQ